MVEVDDDWETETKRDSGEQQLRGQLQAEMRRRAAAEAALRVSEARLYDRLNGEAEELRETVASERWLRAEATHALEAREAELEAARYCWRGITSELEAPLSDVERRHLTSPTVGLADSPRSPSFSPRSDVTEPSPPRHTTPTPTSFHVAPPSTEYRARSPRARTPSSDESFGRRTHRSYQEIHAPPAPRTTPTNPAQPFARDGVRTFPDEWPRSRSNY